MSYNDVLTGTVKLLQKTDFVCVPPPPRAFKKVKIKRSYMRQASVTAFAIMSLAHLMPGSF